MTLAELLAGAGALVTLALGIGGVASPRLAGKLARVGPLERGALAEMRASFGGIYVGLGLAMLAALWAGNGIEGVSLATGAAWIGLALGRLVSLAADRSWTTWNGISFCVESGVGLMLLAPFVAHLGG